MYEVLGFIIYVYISKMRTLANHVQLLSLGRELRERTYTMEHFHNKIFIFVCIETQNIIFILCV